MLHRESEALTILEDGLSYGVDSNAIKTLKADTCILWAHRLKRESAGDQSTTKRLELVFRAAQLAPNRPIVMDAVFDIAMECRKSSDDQMRHLLKNAVQSVDPHVVHTIRGTIAAMEGDTEKALFHLRMAESSGQYLPVIYNNLAVVISQQSDGDLTEALRLSNLAVQRDLNQPSFRETRGQILAKLERYADSIKDLELAVADQALQLRALPTLVECYRRLGQTDTASDYQMQLESLQKSSPNDTLTQGG
jgi:lipopolysaccharide biosynthesis regulator YciM